jgi:large subunit ribosomal protein L10
MPMTKTEKETVVAEIAQMLDANTIVYLTNYSGLTVSQADDLRNRFRNAGVSFKVYKNTLVRLAMEERPAYSELLEYLKGPTAIAFGGEPSAPARVIRDFLKDESATRPEVKAVYIDGAFYGEGSLDTLASLKSKDELIGDVVGLLLAPISNVVGKVQAPARNLAAAIREIADRAA